MIPGPEEAKKNHSGGKGPPPDSDSFNGAESEKNLVNSSSQFAATPNDRFQFHKRSQQFVRLDDIGETFAVGIDDVTQRARAFMCTRARCASCVYPT